MAAETLVDRITALRGQGLNWRVEPAGALAGLREELAVSGPVHGSVAAEVVTIDTSGVAGALDRVHALIRGESHESAPSLLFC